MSLTQSLLVNSHQKVCLFLVKGKNKLKGNQPVIARHYNLYSTISFFVALENPTTNIPVEPSATLKNSGVLHDKTTTTNPSKKPVNEETVKVPFSV